MITSILQTRKPRLGRTGCSLLRSHRQQRRGQGADGGWRAPPPHSPGSQQTSRLCRWGGSRTPARPRGAAGETWGALSPALVFSQQTAERSLTFGVFCYLWVFPFCFSLLLRSRNSWHLCPYVAFQVVRRVNGEVEGVG